MGFSELNQKAISEYAVFAAHKNLAKLQLFSHTFTELEGRPGESIAIPVYNLSACAAFTDNNNYGSATNENDGMMITLSSHLVKSVAITDKQLAYTGVNWARDTGKALAENLTRGVNEEVFKLFNADNITLSATLDTSSKSAVANLYATAEDNDIPVDRCVVVMNPTNFAKILALVDYNMIGSGDYIKTGVIEGLFGFKGFICSSNLPNGVKGVIALDESMGIASKYLAPMTAGAYPEAWAITDESGFTLGARRFMNLNTGADIFAMDCLFGAKLLQPSKCVRLV